jgi:hypothetical protein
MSRKIIFWLGLPGIALFLSGCSGVSAGGYYWGDYSTSYFALVKEASDENKSGRVLALEDIVQKSIDKGIRVPPGVYAELGVMYADRGDIELGITTLRAEIETYPESAIFVNRWIERIRQ